MNYLKIANRNVKRQRRRSNMLAISIAFGTMIILLINMLTTGLTDNAKNMITTSLGGHIYISGDEMQESGKILSKIGDTEILKNALESVNSGQIVSYQKRSETSASLIYFGKSSSSTLYGVDWANEKGLLNDLQVLEGNLDDARNGDSIVIDDSVAEDLGASVGDRIICNFETISGQANVAELNVAAIIKGTSSFGMSSQYVSRDTLNSYLGLEPDEYQMLTIQLKNANLIPVVQKELEDSIESQGGVFPLPSTEEDDLLSSMGMGKFLTDTSQVWTGTRFTVANLNDFMSTMVQVINILNIISFSIFLIMVLITMMGLVNTFRMIMNERVQEIGTMRAIGMQKKEVKKLLNLEGVLVAVRGVLYGLIAAFVVSRIVGLIDFSGNKNPGFAILLNAGHLSFPISLSYVLMVTVLVMGISYLAVTGPVKKALKKSVADELR